MKKTQQTKRKRSRFFLFATMFIIFSIININTINAQDFYNFEGATDLTDYFNGSSGSTFSNTTIGGLDNLGSVSIPSTGTGTWTSKIGYPLEVGTTYTITAYFYNGGNSGWGGLGFGILNQNEIGANSCGIPDISLGMGFHGGGGSFVNNNTESSVNWDDVTDLVIGEWYYMIYSIKYIGTNTFETNFKVYFSDNSGNLGTLKTTHNQIDIINSNVGGASDIYPLFSNSGNRMYNMDDFYVWVASTSFTPPSGTGTLEDPYQIATLDNLAWLSESNESWTSYFIQTANIDASETMDWNGGEGFSPIGSGAVRFTGFYNGDGYTINGIYINRPATNMQGIFGSCSGSSLIENLGATNVNITGSDWVGGIAAHLDITSVENCYSSGTIVGSQGVGGIVGLKDGGNIINCINYSNIGDGTGSTMGGIAGFNRYSGNVTNCYNEGFINGNTNVGGLLGIHDGSAIVTNSYSIGMVAGSSNTGGLTASGSGTAIASFWNMEVSGQGSSVAGTGKTTAEMQTKSTYTSAGWDFVGETTNGTDDVWNMQSDVNNGYPFLENITKIPGQNSLHFDGIDDYVLAPTSVSLAMTTQLTIEVWVKPELADGHQEIVYVSGGGGGAEIEINGGNIGANVSIGGSWYHPAGGSYIAGNWYHVVLVVNNSVAQIFVNGELKGSDAGSGELGISNGSIGIGMHGSLDYYFTGKMDEVRIWNTARTECEINSTMHSELVGDEGGLVAYYNFNQGTAGDDNTGIETLPDLTTNANDGTLTGFALSGTTSNWVSTTSNISGIGQKLTVCEHYPIQGENEVADNMSIEVYFNNDLFPETVNETNFKVIGSTSGNIQGDYTGEGSMVVFAPDLPYYSNETIEVTLTTDIIDIDGKSLNQNYRFSFTIDTLYDFGDLPSVYMNTLLIDEGARHTIGDIYLGENISPEADGQQEALANLDSYDDGIIVPQVSWKDGVDGGIIEVTVTGGDGFLSAWIDWDEDNGFGEGGDKILDVFPVEEGTQMVKFNIPTETVNPGEGYLKFARFRLDNDDTPSETIGERTNGEVEDYQLVFSSASIFIISSKYPANGSSDIPTDAEIEIVFDLYVDPTTVNESTFFLENASGEIIEGTYNINETTITFVPDNPLPSLENMKVTITTDLLSLSGLSLDAEEIFEFVVEEISNPPVITSNPDNSTICAGENTFFFAEANDNGEITYQWQENNGSGFINIIENETYTGTTTNTLTINKASHLLNTYQYKCLISNEIGTTPSNAATLSVDGQLAEAGDNLAFYFDTYPVPTVNDLILSAEAPIGGIIGIWTTTSIGEILTPETYNTTVNGLESGVSIFTWTVTDGAECVNSDELLIIIGSSFVPNSNSPIVDWDNPDNWTPPAIPGANDSVSVYGATVNIDGVEAICNQLYVGVNSTLNVSGSAKGISGVIRTSSIEIEQDIEKYPNAGKGTAKVIIGSGGSIEIEQDIEKNRSNRGLVVGSGGSIEIEQDIEKSGEPASLIIRGLDLIVEGTDLTKAPASVRIGSGGSIEIEQDIEKRAIGNVYIGSNGSIEIEQDIEKGTKGAANLIVRGGGSIEIEQDIEKKGTRGAANLIIRNGGSIEIEQDIEKGATAGSLRIGNGGTLTVEGNYTAKDRSFANVRVGSGGSIEIEQDIEKGSKGVANLVVRGGSIEIEQDIEKGNSGQLFVGTGGSIEIEQDIEKGTFGQVYTPKVVIDNGNIVIGNTAKGGKAGSASLHTGSIEIEQDIEKDRNLFVNLHIMANGDLSYDPSFGLLHNEFIYLDSLAAITVDEGGEIIFDYPNHKKYTINNTASLVGDETALSGKAQYINHFNENELKLFAVPVQNETNEVFENEPILNWTENIAQWGAVIPENTISPINGNKTISSESNNISFEGNLVVGIQTVPLTFNDLEFAQSGWNFIGNPYPSYVDFELITLTDIAPVKYTFNSSTGSFEIYIKGGESLNNGSQYIKDGEGFFVKASQETSLNFDNSQRIHFFNQTIRETRDGEILTLKVTDGLKSDFIKVIFDETATENYDTELDAPSITVSNQGVPSLCILSPNSKELAINSMPAPTDIKVYNMTFKALETGEYTISVENLTIGTEMLVHLKDHDENIVTNLHTTANYTFTANEGVDTERFTLHFNDIFVENNDVTQNAIKIYSNKNTIYIKISDIEGDSKINIIDMKGINLSQKTVNGSGLYEIEMNKATGYYIVNVTTNKGTVSQKVFIMK